MLLKWIWREKIPLVQASAGDSAVEELVCVWVCFSILDLGILTNVSDSVVPLIFVSVTLRGSLLVQVTF